MNNPQRSIYYKLQRAGVPVRTKRDLAHYADENVAFLINTEEGFEGEKSMKYYIDYFTSMYNEELSDLLETVGMWSEWQDAAVAAVRYNHI